MENVKYVVINDNKYKKGNLNVENSGEAYFINNEWVLADNCVYDNTTNEYILKNTGEIYGIVNVSPHLKPIYGYFRETLDTITVSLEKGQYRAINEKIANKLGLIRQNDNIYYVFNRINNVKNVYQPKKVTSEMKTAYPYGASNFDKNIEYLKSMKLKITKRAKEISSLLGGLSYGLEYETVAGVLTDKELMENGLIALRDGSIAGLEYATIPLTGDSGLQTLYNAVNVLSNNTQIDSSCAMHFHVGNIPRTKSFIVALWITMSLIQDQLYSVQNTYKRDPFRFKRKNYSAPLPVYILRDIKIGSSQKDIDSSFTSIIKYLSMGTINRNVELKDIKNHPVDPDNNRKWNVKTRYSILNMIPLIFGNKATVEFRHHDISSNKNDIIYELLCDLAIVKYVMDNETSILNNEIQITLNDILCNIYNKDSYLLDGLFRYLELKRHSVCEAYLKGNHGFVHNISSKDFDRRLKLKAEGNNMSNKDKLSFYNKYYNRSTIASARDISASLNQNVPNIYVISHTTNMAYNDVGVLLISGVVNLESLSSFYNISRNDINQIKESSTKFLKALFINYLLNVRSNSTQVVNMLNSLVRKININELINNSDSEMVLVQTYSFNNNFNEFITRLNDATISTIFNNYASNLSERREDYNFELDHYFRFKSVIEEKDNIGMSTEIFKLLLRSDSNSLSLIMEDLIIASTITTEITGLTPPVGFSSSTTTMPLLYNSITHIRMHESENAIYKISLNNN